MTHQLPKTTSQQNKKVPRSRFVSLRWRFISPVFVVVLLIAMIGAYIVARNISGGLVVSQQNVLLQSSSAVSERSRALYDFQRSEAQRTAFTIGVPEAIQRRDSVALEPMLESLARINEMDSIIAIGLDGFEVLGIQRVTVEGSRVDYALSTEADLSQQEILRSVVDKGSTGETGFMLTPGGLMLYTGVPVNLGDQFVGVVLVGQKLESVINSLKGSAVADLALYGPESDLLQTTFETLENRSALQLGQEVFNQAVLATSQIPVQGMQLDNYTYQAAYQPFNFGPNTLGVVGVFMLDNIPYVTETGRQLTAMMAAALAGAVVVVVFAGISRITGRANKITRVAAELSFGQAQARTGMTPSDEISTVGYALDRYATVVQEKQDAMQQVLRRQRREVNHLMAVIESIPHGVVVQALDGRVMFMNDQARILMGSQRVFRSARIDELAEVSGKVLGPSLAPGLYALGDPHRVHLDERIISAQAAAVMSMSDHRLGTVLLLQDITSEVRQEQERSDILQRLAREIQQPLSGLGRAAAYVDNPDMVRVFAREIVRHSIALQKMIIDMQELDDFDVYSMKRKQQPILMETLVWAVANEWRQVAQANDLTLHIIIERKGLFVLGDEKRLRWALGNIVDNAIKYTLPGGALTLEIQEESEGLANMRVRDNGVGIAKEERQYIFTRFYRGTPRSPEGTVIRVPGMGQGLHIAKQIVEAHGGSIRMKSTEGVGTAVYVSMPLTAPVGMEMPYLQADMDGETVQMPENVLIDLDRKK